MYLINVDTLQLRHFVSDIPPYAILSHTWGDEEVTFADFTDSSLERDKNKAGYQKIQLTCDQAKKDDIEYAWVDTCCINKESSAELSEAINSMYQWYGKAQVCYAYLEDISFPSDGDTSQQSLLEGCRWFSRGWTLQELLAPSEVRFYGPGWVEVGRKAEICETLYKITGIPQDVLRKTKRFEDVSVAARMSWAAKRETTRQEDLAYCLMGIFDVNMPLLYGEGGKAFIRLQEQIMSQVPDDSLFAWCAEDEFASQYPYRGLFASSPREFQTCADLMYFGAGDAGTTHFLGNGRVSLRCAVQKVQDKTILGLMCYREDISKILGIEVNKVGLNSYIRTNPSILFQCSLQSLQDIVIEKFTLQAQESQMDDIHLRDAIHLGDLPQGLSLEAVHPTESFDSPQRTISVVDALHRKVAFELEISKDISGECTPYTGSGQDARLLVLFWVEQQPGLRSYVYRFNVVLGSLEDTGKQFAEARKPEDIYKMREARIGWIVVHIFAAQRQFQGHDVLYLDVQVETDENIKTQMVSRSALLVAEHEAQVAETQRLANEEMETQRRDEEDAQRRAMRAARARKTWSSFGGQACIYFSVFAPPLILGLVFLIRSEKANTAGKADTA